MRKMLRPGNTGMHVTGSFRWPMWVFIVYACCTDSVRYSVNTAVRIIVHAGIGMSFKRIFTSST
uniref:Uncharacterized protein n=1 Tax=Cannabis sativa TaxID=3483 RepID=A0A803QZ10_CANSA